MSDFKRFDIVSVAPYGPCVVKRVITYREHCKQMQYRIGPSQTYTPPECVADRLVVWCFSQVGWPGTLAFFESDVTRV